MRSPNSHTANLRAKILDFGGFDSSRIFSLRGGILMSIGNSPEVSSQRILVGMILVGRLGIVRLGIVRELNPSRFLYLSGEIPPDKGKPWDFSTQGFLLIQFLRTLIKLLRIEFLLTCYWNSSTQGFLLIALGRRL